MLTIPYSRKGTPPKAGQETLVFYSGSAGSSDVPDVFPISIGGRSFDLDLQRDVNGLIGQYFRRQTIDVLRAQADQGNEPSRASLNPEDLWRRTQDDWSHGAGQVHFDRKDISDASRFHSSKGIDPWTRWQISLLPDTLLQPDTSGDRQFVFAAAGRLYRTKGTKLQYSIGLNSPFVDCTGEPGQKVVASATDGYNIWLSYSTGVMATTTTTSGALTPWGTQSFNPTVLAYVRGRLMAALGPSIYDLSSPATGPTSAPTALMTQGNPQFQWVGFTEGPALIYAAGRSNDKSLIYSIGITSDGTTLSAPVVAGELPIGEQVQCIAGYLGYLVIGTNVGVRLASVDSAGNLTIGASIATTSPVTALSAFDRFVYFAWNNYDTASTGLGRLDLSVFTVGGAPAFATDLMAPTQGTVTSIAQAFGTQSFTITTPTADYLAQPYPDFRKVVTGSLNTGLISYDLADPKVAMFASVRTTPLEGSYALGITADYGDLQPLGLSSTASTTANPPEFLCQETVGELHELTITLNRDTGTISNGPTVTSWTLRSYPAPTRSSAWTLPLLVSARESPYDAGDVTRVVEDDVEFLFQLADLRHTTTLQISDLSFTGFVSDADMVFDRQTNDKTGWEGTVVVTFKQVVGG